MLPKIGRSVSETPQQPKHYSAVIGQAKNRLCFYRDEGIIGRGLMSYHSSNYNTVIRVRPYLITSNVGASACKHSSLMSVWFYKFLRVIFGS